MDFLKIYGSEDIIVKENDFAHFFYILKEGKIAILKDDILIDTLDKPQVPFGILALFSGGQRTATVKALTKCSIYQIPFRHLEKFFSTNKTFGINIIKTVIMKLKKTTQTLSVYKNIFDIYEYLEIDNLMKLIDYSFAKVILENLVISENHKQLIEELKRIKFNSNPDYLSVADKFGVRDFFIDAVKKKFLAPPHITDYFNAADKKDIEDLELPANTLLFKEGEQTDYVIKLFSGEICMIKDNRILNIITSFNNPMYFGEMGAILNIPRTTTIITLKKSHVSIVFNIVDKIESNYGYFIDIMNTIVSRIKKTTNDFLEYRKKFIQSKDDRNKPVLSWDLRFLLLNQVITEKNISIEDKSYLFALVTKLKNQDNEKFIADEVERIVRQYKLSYYYELLEAKYNELYNKLNQELERVKQY